MKHLVVKLLKGKADLSPRPRPLPHIWLWQKNLKGTLNRGG